MGLPRQHLASIVGANIATIRASRGLSQGELAEKLGVSPTQLSRWENGKVGPRFERLEDIANILHCTVAELFLTASDKQHFLRALMPRNVLSEEQNPYCASNSDALDHTTRSELQSLVERIGKLLG